MFLSLSGTLRSEEAFELDKCLNHTDKFERGSEDIFEFRLPPLGNLLSAKVMHDNSGLTNADVCCPPRVFQFVASCVPLLTLTLHQWHLKEIEIVDTRNGQSFTFACGQWLSREIAERKRPGRHSLSRSDDVQLERVGDSDSDVRVSLVIEQPAISSTPILYRLCML